MKRSKGSLEAKGQDRSSAGGGRSTNRALPFVTERSDAVPRALSLSEQIAEQISQAILREQYSPGQRILEQQISEEFQVSRGPVREALRILESDGLIHILPRRGARVTLLTVKEIDDIYDIRATLLELATRRFVEIKDQRAVADLGHLVRRLKDLVPYDDRTHEYANTSYEATMLVVARCGNDRLREMIASLARQTIRYTKLAIVNRERREQSARAWERLLKAAAGRQTDAAGNAARRLVEDAHRAAVAVIKSRGDAAA